jgi:hypothetical protein
MNFAGVVLSPSEDPKTLVGITITDDDLIRTTVFIPNGIFNSKASVSEALALQEEGLAQADHKRLYVL